MESRPPNLNLFEGSNDIKIFLDEFIPKNGDVVYLAGSNEVVAQYTHLKIPDSYTAAPFLATYYIRELLSSCGSITPENVEWPNPGIIVSTILEKAQKLSEENALIFPDTLRRYICGNIKEVRDIKGSLLTLKLSSSRNDSQVSDESLLVYKRVSETLRSLVDYEEAIKVANGKKQIRVNFTLNDYLITNEVTQYRLKAFHVFSFVTRIFSCINLSQKQFVKELTDADFKMFECPVGMDVIPNAIQCFRFKLNKCRLFQLGLQTCKYKSMNRELYNLKWGKLLRTFNPRHPYTIYPVFEDIFLDTLSLDSNEVLPHEINILAEMIKSNKKCIFEISQIMAGLELEIRILTNYILKELGRLQLSDKVDLQGTDSIISYGKLIDIKHVTDLCVVYTPSRTNGIVNDVNVTIQMKIIPHGPVVVSSKDASGSEMMGRVASPDADCESENEDLVRQGRHRAIIIESSDDEEEEEHNDIEELHTEQLRCDSEVLPEEIPDELILNDSKVLTDTNSKIKVSQSNNEQPFAIASSNKAPIRTDELNQSPEHSSCMVNLKADALVKNSESIEKFNAEALQLKETITSLKTTVERQKRQLSEKDDIINEQEKKIRLKKGIMTSTLNDLTQLEKKARQLESLLVKPSLKESDEI